MLTGSLASAGVTGFMIKYWVKSGGVFAVGMIFMKFAMPMIAPWAYFKRYILLQYVWKLPHFYLITQHAFFN